MPTTMEGDFISNFTDTYCGKAKAQGLCANFEEQNIYWSVANFLNFFGLFLFFYLFYEYKTNPSVTTNTLRPFSIVLLSDILWLAIFVPFHLHNSILSGKNAERLVEIDQGWRCKLVAYFVALSVGVAVVGLVFIAYLPYRMITQVEARRYSSEVAPTKLIIVFLIIGIIFGSGNYIVGIPSNNNGNFRGLYCGPIEWDSATGIYLFVQLTVCFSALVYFMAKSFFSVKKIANSFGDTSGNSNLDGRIVSTQKHTLRAARLIFRYSIIIAGAFLVCYGSFAVTTFLNFIGKYPPIEFEILSGWMIKLKPITNILVILSLPNVRNTRRKCCSRDPSNDIHASLSHPGDPFSSQPLDFDEPSVGKIVA